MWLNGGVTEEEELGEDSGDVYHQSQQSLTLLCVHVSVQACVQVTLFQPNNAKCSCTLEHQYFAVCECNM